MTNSSSHLKRALSDAAALGLSALVLSGAANASCSVESYTGSVCLTAATFCPKGTIEANGQTLEIANFTSLFALIGNAYGGNGTVTFAVPDLRGRVPVGIGQGPSLSPVDRGQQRGYETVTQSVDQMPSHSHEATFTANASDPATVEVAAQQATNNKVTEKNMLAEPNTGPSPADAVNLFSGPSNATVPLAGVSGGTNTGGTVTVANTGGGSSMVVLNPQLGMRYCIVTNGAFPARADETQAKK